MIVYRAADDHHKSGLFPLAICDLQRVYHPRSSICFFDRIVAQQTCYLGSRPAADSQSTALDPIHSTAPSASSDAIAPRRKAFPSAVFAVALFGKAFFYRPGDQAGDVAVLEELADIQRGLQLVLPVIGERVDATRNSVRSLREKKKQPSRLLENWARKKKASVEELAN